MDDTKLPNIGSGKSSGAPLADFMRSDHSFIAKPILQDMNVMIPPLYYWETVESGVSVLMTAAFMYKGMKFGESYEIPVPNNYVKIQKMRKKLIKKVTQTMDVLVQHGKQVLDSAGNIDPRKVMDQEAIRFKYDPLWDKRVAAFNKLVRVAPITRSQAVNLGLLHKPNK